MDFAMAEMEKGKEYEKDGSGDVECKSQKLGSIDNKSPLPQ